MVASIFAEAEKFGLRAARARFQPLFSRASP